MTKASRASEGQQIEKGPRRGRRRETADPETATESPTARMRRFMASDKSKTADALDDYNSNFREFVAFGDLITAEMRHRMEISATATEASLEDADRPKSGSTSIPSGQQTAGAATLLPAVGFPGISFFKDRCSHGVSRFKGCRHCIESCPTSAISSGKTVPEFDDRRCTECGACITACPANALQWPHPGKEIEWGLLKQAVAARTETEPFTEVIIFDPRQSRAISTQLPKENAIVLSVSPLGLVGAGTLLAVLAYGGHRVQVATDPSLDAKNRSNLEKSVQTAAFLLGSLGYCTHRLGIRDLSGEPAENIPISDGVAIAPAAFLPESAQHRLIQRAMGHLLKYAPNPVGKIPLPAELPFGAVEIDQDRCTLCMACAGVCRTNALKPLEGERAGLGFSEDQCVQCGLCARVCPEQAVHPIPRLNLSPTSGSPTCLCTGSRVLCAACGKELGPSVLVDAVKSKLMEHWMFRDADALRHLDLCDQCRVKHIFARTSRQR